MNRVEIDEDIDSLFRNINLFEKASLPNELSVSLAILVRELARVLGLTGNTSVYGARCTMVGSTFTINILAPRGVEVFILVSPRTVSVVHRFPSMKYHVSTRSVLWGQFDSSFIHEIITTTKARLEQPVLRMDFTQPTTGLGA